MQARPERRHRIDEEVWRMARARINGPVHRITDPEYQRECQSALEPSLSWLAEEAVISGWDHEEVVCALMLMSARRLVKSGEHLQSY